MLHSPENATKMFHSGTNFALSFVQKRECMTVVGALHFEHKQRVWLLCAGCTLCFTDQAYAPIVCSFSCRGYQETSLSKQYVGNYSDLK